MSESDDAALRARQAERDRSCGAGADLHAELLPPGHPLRDVVPALADHPLQDHIESARSRHLARRPLAAARPARRGIPWATWVPGIPNFTPGRAGHDMWTEPRYIVLHTMVGWESSARARFMQPAQQASSTYGITLKGELFQYTDERDGPWTNGTIYGPIGGNLDSITLEHEDGGDYNGPRTPELYAASARAVRDIADFYGIPLDRAHVVHPHELGHRECSNASTACPDSLDLQRIVSEALAIGGSTPVTGDDEVTPEQFDAMLRDSPLFREWLAATFRVWTRQMYRKDPGPAPEPWNWNNWFQAAHAVDPTVGPEDAVIEFIVGAKNEFGGDNDMPVHPDQVQEATGAVSDDHIAEIARKAVEDALANG